MNEVAALRFLSVATTGNVCMQQFACLTLTQLMLLLKIEACHCHWITIQFSRKCHVCVLYSRLCASSKWITRFTKDNSDWHQEIEEEYQSTNSHMQVAAFFLNVILF